MRRFKIKDIVFLAVISAVTMCTCAVMPLVVSLQTVIFGIAQTVTCTQISVFFTIGIEKTQKTGSLFIMALFMGIIQLLMAPIMFFSSVFTALITELVVYAAFRGFEKKASLYLTMILFNTLSLPFNALYNYFFGREALFAVVRKNPWLAILMTCVVVALSALGTFLGLLISRELKKAGAFKK